MQPNSVTCSSLLKSLTRTTPASGTDRVMALVDGMQEKMDEVLFSSVAEACIRVGRLDASAELVDLLRKEGNASTELCTALSAAFSEARAPTQVNSPSRR